MSKEVEKRSQELYDKLAQNPSKEEIEQLCKDERTWLEERYKPTTMGTKLSNHYNKKIDSIPLNESNSYFTQGRSGQKMQKHLFHQYCGFSSEEWQERSDYVPEDKESLPEKIENAPAINPQAYLDKTADLLKSSDPYELASGLIAATGCRSIEIIHTGKFTATDDPYKIKFSGQAKKRGKNPTFERPTLFPASYLIKELRRFRKFSEIVEVANFAKNELTKGESEEEVNKAINNKRGRLVWDRTSDAFAGIIPPKFGDKYVNNQALRSAFGTLVVVRDCEDMSDAAKMIYFGRAIGHIATDEELKKSDLFSLATTIGYGVYRVERGQDVPFMPASQPKTLREKATSVRILKKDLKRLKAIQDELNAEDLSQHEMLSNILDLAEEALENRKKQFGSVQIETKQGKEAIEETKVTEPEEKDFSHIPTEELKGAKTPGTAKEKLERAVTAVMNYNDYVAPSNEDRFYVNVSIMRQLTGVRYASVKDFFKEYGNMIDDHNAKYELTPYQNQRLGKKGVNIEDAVKW